MAIETTKWDGTEYLGSPEAIAAYLEAAFEDGDPKVITHAIGNIARTDAEMTKSAFDKIKAAEHGYTKADWDEVSDNPPITRADMATGKSFKDALPELYESIQRSRGRPAAAAPSVDCISLPDGR